MGAAGFQSPFLILFNPEGNRCGIRKGNKVLDKEVNENWLEEAGFTRLSSRTRIQASLVSYAPRPLGGARSVEARRICLRPP